MHLLRSLLPLLTAATLAAGCRSTAPSLPAGAGLRAADRQAPDGAASFDRPEWSEGDELRYLRANRIGASTVVRRIEDGYALVDPQSGRELVLDLDLARRGERESGADAFEVALDPFDPAYAWPLWPGKRWTGEYVLRTGRGPDLPVVARYHCEGLEEVTVPAGTFRCLRIWRRDTVDSEGNFLERTSIDWYAPELGHVVRRLEDGLETVLVEFLIQDTDRP